MALSQAVGFCRRAGEKVRCILSMLSTRMAPGLGWARGLCGLLRGVGRTAFLGVLLALSGGGALHAEERLSLQRLEALLRAEPGLVILVRHAETVSGIGDPPGFRLEDCSTQRNLSAEGRAQARRMGLWFASRGLVPTAVRSSQWCRCLDTAQEAFTKVVSITPWSALNSTFQGRGDSQSQQAQIQRHLMARSLGQSRVGVLGAQAVPMDSPRPPVFEVWVTHQVMISALTGQYVSMGEMVVARPGAEGRLQPVGRVSSDFR